MPLTLVYFCTKNSLVQSLCNSTIVWTARSLHEWEALMCYLCLDIAQRTATKQFCP